MLLKHLKFHSDSLKYEQIRAQKTAVCFISEGQAVLSRHLRLSLENLCRAKLLPANKENPLMELSFLERDNNDHNLNFIQL